MSDAAASSATMSASAQTLLPLATPEQRAKIEGAAKDFEAQLVGIMFQPMFEGLSTSGPFSGGQAEGTYRSFMLDAFGKQMVKAGGVGVAGPVMREMLRMQGLR